MHFIHRRVLLLFALSLFVGITGPSQTPGIDGLQKGFAEPPDDARVMMRWWWFGPSVTKQEIERELAVMKAGGIGGVEVQPVYPLLPDDPKSGIRNLPFLSDEFLEMLRFTSAKCKEMGMRFDLTLGSGWSFGGAKTPITEAAGQLRIERVKLDVNTTQVPVPYMIPAEKLLTVFAVKQSATPSERDVKELTNLRDGRVLLPADSSNFSELLFFISGKSGMQVKRPAVGAEGYVLNHLDKPSVENYLKTTGDRLFTRFDKTEIPYSVFCDSLEVYNQDWTDDFLEEFQRRRGYDLKPHLPGLVMDIGPRTADIRYDWGRTITELFNDRFMIPMKEWTQRNHTRFRIQGYGLPPAAISSNEWADISDGEGAQWKVVRAARWASSANHIYGRNITSSETWTWLHSPVFRATPLDLKAEADIHFLQGINQLIGHGFAYTPPQVEYPGWRFYAAGIYDEKNPWWIVMPDLARYLQRMSWLMRQGTPSNDVALYLPNADAYAHFTAGRVHLIDVERELVGNKIMPAIFQAGYNLDFFDDEMLQKLGRMNGSELVLGSSAHRIVVLPGVERIPLESLRKLDQFVRGGGKLIATRRIPSIDPGMKVTDAERSEFAAIIKRLFNATTPGVKFVENENDIGPAMADSLDPDVSTSPSSADLGFVHRRTKDADIYFIVNTSNEKLRRDVTFRTTARSATVWDAIDGGTSDIDFTRQTDSSKTLTLDFEPYQSHVVIFSDKPFTPTKARLDTHADSVVQLGPDWKVTFEGGPSMTMPRLHSWSEDEATKNFSGVAVYEKSFELEGSALNKNALAFLDFGSGKPLAVQETRNGMQTWFDPPIREAAVIFVNGQRAGSLWCPPYRLEIGRFLKRGKNDLKILVGNTALNSMAATRLPDYKLLNLRYGERFQPQDMDKIEVLPSGILGSPTLILNR